MLTCVDEQNCNSQPVNMPMIWEKSNNKMLFVVNRNFCLVVVRHYRGIIYLGIHYKIAKLSVFFTVGARLVVICMGEVWRLTIFSLMVLLVDTQSIFRSGHFHCLIPSTEWLALRNFFREPGEEFLVGLDIRLNKCCHSEPSNVWLGINFI